MSQTLVSLLKEKNFSGLKEFLIGYTQYMVLSSFMAHTRMYWSPQCGAGSQTQDTKPYRMLMHAMEKVLSDQEEEEKEWM